MQPITVFQAGDTVTVKKICGDAAVRLRLAELGFVVDEEVTILSKSGGDVILSVKDSRVAVGMEMACNILV